MAPVVQIKRTATPNHPPAALAEGELCVEMADPVKLWVGVPTSIKPEGKRLLTAPPLVVQADPPLAPEVNQLWWENDSGILWLWYNDGNSSQWVQISSSGGQVTLPPTPAEDIEFTPGGSLSADDVQEALLELDNEKVAKAGDQMAGPLLLISSGPTDVNEATRKGYVDAQIAALTTIVNGKIGDAPNDGKTYGRKNLAWAEVVAGGGTAATVTFTPTGNVAANNVQTAIAEVDNEKVAKAGDTMTGQLTMSGSGARIIAAQKWHQFGTAAGTLATGVVARADANIIFYDAGDNVNWSGVGTDTSGQLWFRVGLTGSPVPALYISTDQVTHFAGNVVVGKATPILTLDKTASGQAVNLIGSMAGKGRWNIVLGNASAETGANVGSDYILWRYDDAGNPVAQPMMINRASGQANFEQPPLPFAATPWTEAQRLAARSAIYAAPLDAVGYNGFQLNGNMALITDPATGTTGQTAVNANGFFFLADTWKVAIQNSNRSYQTLMQASSPIGPYFANALNIQCTANAGATIAANDLVMCYAAIEYARVRKLGWGTANAQPITVSFWCAGTVGGTIGVAVRNNAADRNYVVPVTVTAPWDYYVVTIPGDTGGSWNVGDAAVGMYISVTWHSGSNFKTATPGVWQAGNMLATNAVSEFFGTNNNAVAIGSIMFHPGNDAPSKWKQPMMHRHQGDELMQIKRYLHYYDVYAAGQTAKAVGAYQGVNPIFFPVQFPTGMRSIPSATIINMSNFLVNANGTPFAASNVTCSVTTPWEASIAVDTGALNATSFAAARLMASAIAAVRFDSRL